MSQKSIKIWYWIITLLFAAFMLFSGISEIVGPEEGKDIIVKLGYPSYLNIILGTAKILGVIILVQTKFKTIKEWAYAGFAIDFIGASASYALNGDGLASALLPLPFLIVMFLSYVLWKKKEDYI
ncbi:MAG: DoxX family protein [Nanoarchaeota archaeon]